jgi:Skp family chaperone for outer membrane proteins
LRVKNVIEEYGIKNQYRAIYNSARMSNVNEGEDLTDTIISILNGK